MTDANLGAHIEAVARKLLGEPNREKSTNHQLRFGNQGSMAVEIGGNKAGTWYDFENKVGGGVMELIKRETGLVNGAAFDWLREMGIEVGPAPRADQRIAATYDYTDEAGKPLFQVVRYEPKRFVQRRRAEDGRWVWGLKAGKYWLGKTGWKLDRGNIPADSEVRDFPECPRVPYRLPELLTAIAEGKTIWIPEGEKDVENLRRLGFDATCNPGGKLRPVDIRERSGLPNPAEF
jgi:putative DNA primase/helicase